MLVTLGVVVAVLVGVFYVAGGWYFAGRIQSGGLHLDVSTGVPAYDLQVTAVTPTSVTLTAPDGAPTAFTQPSNYSLMWDGGSAHVGAVSVPSDATEVTRPLSDVIGTPLTVGTKVALERDWYLEDPKASLGLDFSTVQIATPLGIMPAWYVPASGTTWAVMVHGKGGLRREFLRTIPLVHAAGMPALVITYRNDAGNPQDPDPRFGYGATEWPDLEMAVDYATAHGAAKVLIYADSMGASVTAAYLQHSDHVPAMTAMVFDAPMLSFEDAVDLGASRTSIPVVGLPVPSSLTWVAKQIAGRQYGIDWAALDYASDTSWVTVPVLVLHGAADPTAPVTTSERFAAANPGTVRLEEFAAAAHMESWNTDRARYEALVAPFLAAHTT
ncbi:MAG TPA: alpha/beta hydrolase [Candidatus Nanopelagicales bacterium]|nr:alpha/beta hydrolase [Candidatus Nanopelagicales bacterium]